MAFSAAGQAATDKHRTRDKISPRDNASNKKPAPGMLLCGAGESLVLHLWNDSDIVNVRTCQKWLSKFRSGDLSLQENDRSGRPSKIDNDVLLSMLENNPHLTSQEIAEEFGIHHTSVGDHIESLGFVLKRSVWVPHELTEKNLSKHNIKRKESYCKPGTSSATVPKPSIHQQKVLLCLWWDRKGPVYYELLKQGKTINAELYCNQLDKLNAAIKEKRPILASRKGIVFHHDNAGPHIAMVTQQKLNALGWEVLGHPPYSTDMVPSDYYLFRSLQNYLTKKKSLLKVFGRQLLTILTPRTRTSTK
ncbi:histone-lysine N-methyltransferase SETMAR [Trichonephila clavipes]|nr:histone-lysine N-methyltransferase SETMAR [Trichonephila clavipes]